MLSLPNTVTAGNAAQSPSPLAKGIPVASTFALNGSSTWREREALSTPTVTSQNLAIPSFTKTAWQLVGTHSARLTTSLAASFPAPAPESLARWSRAGVSRIVPWPVTLATAAKVLAHFGVASMQAPTDALSWAVANGHSRIAGLLLDWDVDPNFQDGSGSTPLLRAVRSGNWPVAARLVQAGAKANIIDPEGITPLMIAAAQAPVDLLDVLLNAGADPNRADAQGRNALYYALTAKRADALERLLSADARVDVKLPDKRDLCAVALELNDWKLITPVLGRVESRPWDSPARRLLKETLYGRQAERLRLLVTKHQGPATLEGTKDPLLAYAAVRNDIEMARLLLEAGADPNTTMPGKAEESLLSLVPQKALRHYLTYEPGIPVIAIAAGLGHTQMLELLMQHGAEKNRPTKSKHRLVPIYFAAWGNHAEAIQTLIGNAPKPSQMRIEISLGLQEAVLYKNNVPIFRTDISSGKSETPTQTGRFVVTDKKRHHVSNLYDAKMPYFMRLSCKDFGLHEGYLPGYPASHGCVRLPREAAQRLFRDVPIGTLVTIR
jgi:ankyrin repeat protein